MCARLRAAYGGLALFFADGYGGRVVAVKWRPAAFLPERFLAAGESAIEEGTYIPFGVGPHTCIGAGFAQAEAVLIMAEVVRRFDFSRADDSPVRPAARLTTRPAHQIRLHCQPA